MSQKTQTESGNGSNQSAHSRRSNDGRALSVQAAPVDTGDVSEAATFAHYEPDAADAIAIVDTAIQQSTSVAEGESRDEFADRVACAKQQLPRIAERILDSELDDYITLDVDTGDYALADSRGASVESFVEKYGSSRRTLTGHVGAWIG